MFACELSASIGCVLDRVRGIPSRLIAVTPLAARAAASAGSARGLSIPITACPGRSAPSSSSSGLVTVRMMSAAETSSGRLTIVASASA